MDTIYTTTITDEARQRGIKIEVIDAATPIFVLKRGKCAVRCFNALTDRVGAVSFYLAQDKHLANQFLARHGIPVPQQIKYHDWPSALAFLKKFRRVVVKPCREWGGRGVSVAVETPVELRKALRRARAFGEDIVIEEHVCGHDYRLIIIDSQLAAAIERRPASVIGNGSNNIRTLIKRRNAEMRRIDPSCRIPLDTETERNLRLMGFSYQSVPAAGQRVQVRLTTNYHTGGEVVEITGIVPSSLIHTARRVARLVAVPVLGVDFLSDKAGRSYHVVELSPDLAISPPEGGRVAKRFLDFLFPETCKSTSK